MVPRVKVPGIFLPFYIYEELICAQRSVPARTTLLMKICAKTGAKCLPAWASIYAVVFPVAQTGEPVIIRQERDVPGLIQIRYFAGTG